MHRRDVLRTVGSVGAVATLVGCLGQGGDGDGDATSPESRGSVAEAEMDENLAIEESSLYREEGAFGVRGRVENTGDRPMTNVEVHARLLDPDGGIVGEFYDDHADETEVWRLDPGEDDAFDVRFEGTEPADVEGRVRYEVWADGTVE